MIEFQQLVGAWQLVTATMRGSDGSTSAHIYGPNPKGLLLYTPDGGVSATIESAAGDGDIAVCYAGRVSVADDVVTHHILVGNSTFPAGTDLVRDASFGEDGDLNLVVTQPDGAVKITLVWRAVPAQT